MNVYTGDEYLGTRTVVECEDTKGPGGGYHEYKVRFVGDDQSRDQCLEINFQKGPVAETGINGIQDEGLLAILIHRLQAFQEGPFACRENGLALESLQEAHYWLEARKRDRVQRGVEGKNQT